MTESSAFLLRPEVDVETVKTAYEMLRRMDDDVSGHPFLGFVLVQRRLQVPQALSGRAAEQHALFGLLVDEMTGQLAELRARYGLQPPLPDDAQDVALQQLEEDGQCDSNLLMACSAVYYRYCRSNLELAIQTIATYLGQEEGTLRRHVRHWWRHLTAHFVQLETKAREEDRRHRCLLALPYQRQVELPSQQNLVNQLFQEITHQETNSVMLHGVPGIGKTTLMLQLGQHLVEGFSVGEVVWLNLKYSSVQNLDKDETALAILISEKLQIPHWPGQSPVQAIMSHLRFLHDEDQRLLLLLNDVDGWEIAINRAWHWLSHCLLLLTALSPLEHPATRQVKCSPLSREESFIFLKFIIRRQKNAKYAYDPGVMQHLFDNSGGNPGALLKAIIMLDVLPPKANISDVFSKAYYLEWWGQQTNSTRQIWLLLGLLSMQRKAQVSYHEFLRLAQMFLGLTDKRIGYELATLVNAGLVDNWIEAQNYFYASHDIAWSILSTQATLLGKTLPFFIENICSIDVGESKHLAYDLILYIMQHKLVRVEGLWELARHALSHVVRYGLWQHWYNCLHELQQTADPPPEEYLWLQFELSRALRWLGKFGEALALLAKIPHRADLVDNPLRMARLLIERAATLLYLNDTKEALHLAYEAYERIGDQSPELRDQSVVIIAQALYDFSPEQSRDWLRRLSRPDVEALGLEARVALRLGETRLALQHARESVARLSPDEPAYARTVGLLAQSMVANGEVEAAIQHFQLAINHLQRRQDLVGIARLHNNLGVVFHMKQDIQRATEQFQKSLEIHRRLQDFSGQQTAQENLSYVLAKQSASGGTPRFLTDHPDFHSSQG